MPYKILSDTLSHLQDGSLSKKVVCSSASGFWITPETVGVRRYPRWYRRSVGKGCRGRDGSYLPPPRRSRRAAFLHRAPAGSQAWSMFGAWAAHTVSTRGPMPQGTCLVRLCVRGMHRHRPLLPAGSLPSTPSAAAPRGLVRGFIGTMDPSDSSDLPIRLRLLAFPNRPGTALAAAGGRRSPRFRRDPFVRDVASDPGRATVPRITAPHMLPSAIATASAPATSRFYRGRYHDRGQERKKPATQFLSVL